MGCNAPVYNKYRYDLYSTIIREKADAKGRQVPPDSLKNERLMSPLITKAVQDEFSRRHMLRLAPEPEPYKRNLAHINRQDRLPLFKYMATWNFTNQLPTIQTPTLLLGSRYDFIPAFSYTTMHRQLPHSQVYICPDGSHFAMWDDPQHYFPALLKFLKKTARND